MSIVVSRHNKKNTQKKIVVSKHIFTSQFGWLTHNSWGPSTSYPHLRSIIESLIPLNPGWLLGIPPLDWLIIPDVIDQQARVSSHSPKSTLPFPSKSTYSDLGQPRLFSMRISCGFPAGFLMGFQEGHVKSQHFDVPPQLKSVEIGQRTWMRKTDSNNWGNIAGWWFEPLWKILVNGTIIPNIWENKKCSKPPTSCGFVWKYGTSKSIG